MRGPIGRMSYFGDGSFRLGTKEKPVKYYEKKYNKVGLLCGGTGITPIFQLLQSANVNRDTIEYSLIFGNRTSKDILLKKELDEFYTNQNFKFNVQYTIDNEEDGWDGLVGYITKDKIEKYIQPPADDTLIMICGRGKMCKKHLIPILLDIGYKIENIYKF
jgi:cytochrome-b5 reductase